MMSVSRKELYSGSMVIFIALFYLLSTGSQLFALSENNFEWHDWKLLILSAFYLLSGILFLLKRKAGWIMSTGVLLNFVLVMIVFIASLSQAGAFNSYAALAVMLFFLLLLAFIFLFGKNTRKKYGVNNKSYLATIGIYLLLITINFWV